MNKHTAKRIRQNRHRLYHASHNNLSYEFKQAVKALPMPPIKPTQRIRRKP